MWRNVSVCSGEDRRFFFFFHFIWAHLLALFTQPVGQCNSCTHQRRTVFTFFARVFHHKCFIIFGWSSSYLNIIYIFYHPLLCYYFLLSSPCTTTGNSSPPLFLYSLCIWAFFFLILYIAQRWPPPLPPQYKLYNLTFTLQASLSPVRCKGGGVFSVALYHCTSATPLSPYKNRIL